jgi:hypothetical protein
MYDMMACWETADTVPDQPQFMLETVVLANCDRDGLGLE